MHFHLCHPLLFAFAAAAFMLCSAGKIADYTEWDGLIAQALRDVLHAHRIEPKVAADIFGLDRGNFSKWLSADLHISLNKLFRLPMPVLADFLGRILWLKTKDFVSAHGLIYSDQDARRG